MALKRGKGKKGHVACTRPGAVDWLEGQGTGYKGLTELTTGELFYFSRLLVLGARDSRTAL